VYIYTGDLSYRTLVVPAQTLLPILQVSRLTSEEHNPIISPIFSVAGWVLSQLPHLPAMEAHVVNRPCTQWAAIDPCRDPCIHGSAMMAACRLTDTWWIHGDAYQESYMLPCMSNVQAMNRQAPWNWRLLDKESILLASATVNDPLLPVQPST